MISYIWYKLKNRKAVKAETKKIAPLLRSRDGDFTNFCKNIFFDFSDRTTHLGDRLFFIPLVNELIASGFSVTISSKDDVTSALTESISDLSLRRCETPSEHDVVIYPAPSCLNFRKNYPEAILVDFTDTSVASKISDQLISSVSELFRLDLRKNFFRPFEKPKIATEFIPRDNSIEYYLFSNYIDSGRFRKFFIDENKLLAKADEIAKQGYKIIHVGSKQDKANDKKCYPFVDVDLRGQTSITDLIQMIQSENIIGAITYDNFLMHLVGMYGKTAYVLFRGRFTRKNREHHMLYVNNTFFDQKDKLIYL